MFIQNKGGNYAAIKLKKEHPEFEIFFQVEVNGLKEDFLYKYLKKVLPGRFWFTP